MLATKPALFRTLPLFAAVSIATHSLSAGAQQLEEIIVTAQKRAESLQDVPISVSAIQGEKIQDAGIPNMAALADYVPNLHIADAPVNTNIYMRGVGSGNNQGFEQSVGMYIDGVYMGRGRQYRAGFLDVERVEVLRGPQGTLFGRNTVAGAVNITSASARAGDELTGQVMASAESFDGRVLEGFVGGGVTDTLGVRLAMKYRETDGFADNTFLGRPEGSIEELSWRLSLNWQPTDDLNVNFKYTKSDYERIGASTTDEGLPYAGGARRVRTQSQRFRGHCVLDHGRVLPRLSAHRAAGVRGLQGQRLRQLRRRRHRHRPAPGQLRQRPYQHGAERRLDRRRTDRDLGHRLVRVPVHRWRRRGLAAAAVHLPRR
jgi:outer membrane receptor for ferrienterochelin and colicin